MSANRATLTHPMSLGASRCGKGSARPHLSITCLFLIPVLHTCSLISIRRLLPIGRGGHPELPLSVFLYTCLPSKNGCQDCQQKARGLKRPEADSRLPSETHPLRVRQTTGSNYATRGEDLTIEEPAFTSERPKPSPVPVNRTHDI